MDVLILLIPVVIILGAFAVISLVWAIKSGQFDDLEGDSRRILFSNKKRKQKEKKKEKKND